MKSWVRLNALKHTDFPYDHSQVILHENRLCLEHCLAGLTSTAFACCNLFHSYALGITTVGDEMLQYVRHSQS